MKTWSQYLEEHQERFLGELVDFLRIPSISALPAHAGDIAAAAGWVKRRMQAAGLEKVQILPTDGHPAVYGQWLNAPGKPTLLIYGHYDTQPVDPLDLWENPPFDPVIKDGRIYARGATDDKGNMLIPILVAEAMLQTQGHLPVNFKFLFEGEEEVGSPNMSSFIEKNRDLLACDLILSADGGQWKEDIPALVLGTRGIVAVFVEVEGPGHDLHSGTYGGAIANPIHALVKVACSFHDEAGRVAVRGFYDDVRDLTDTQRAQLAQTPFDEAAFLTETGASALFGEPGFSTFERIGARPTLEINGIWGGFQGEGTKTVLPAQAHAKITCRLVADQKPERIAELIRNHIEENQPAGVRVKVTLPESGAGPYLIDETHPGLDVARSVLAELYQREPYRVRMGGTIPVNAMFLKLLNAYTLVFAFGLQDERQHSPNEFFRLQSFSRGQIAYGRLWEKLGQQL
jgi:acetylornithine deacetylase/succinyl-diaminopimelate desuccinylase-like protein